MAVYSENLQSKRSPFWQKNTLYLAILNFGNIKKKYINVQTCFISDRRKLKGNSTSTHIGEEDLQKWESAQSGGINQLPGFIVKA